MPLSAASKRFAGSRVVGLLWLLGALACGTTATPKGDFFFVHTPPDRFSCLLVVPFANLSNLEQAGGAASKVLVTHLSSDPRFHAFDANEILSAIGSADSSPSGSLGNEEALALASLVGADGVLFGSVSGSWGQELNHSSLLFEARLVSAKSGDAVWGASKVVRRDDHPPSRTFVEVLEEEIGDMVGRLQEELLVVKSVAHQACLHPQVRDALKARAQRPKIPEETKPVASAAAEKPVQEPEKAPSEQGTPAAKEAVSPPETATASPSSGEPSDPAQDSADARVLAELEKGEPVLFPGVIFVERSTRIEQLSSPLTAPLGRIMRARPALRLQVMVHIDPGKSPLDDEKLTLGQAISLAKELASLWKIPGGRLLPIGKGSELPIQPNISRKGRLANRRVEIRLIDD